MVSGARAAVAGGSATHLAPVPLGDGGDDAVQEGSYEVAAGAVDGREAVGPLDAAPVGHLGQALREVLEDRREGDVDVEGVHPVPQLVLDVRPARPPLLRVDALDKGERREGVVEGLDHVAGEGEGEMG